MDLDDRVVIVTGGRGGLGSVICAEFIANGCRVVSVDVISTDAGRQTPGAIQIVADVSTSAGANQICDGALDAFGRIDILVNNAGINQLVPFPDLDALTDELWDSILAVNLGGPWRCVRAIAPIMKANGQGRIISIASTAGLGPTGSSIAYAVSKAGLIHLTRCLAVALAPDISVTAVAPGLMENTGVGARLSPEYLDGFRGRAALGRTVDPADVARTVITLARSDSTTGSVYPVDAGSTMR